MNRSIKRGVAVTVALLLLTTTIGGTAWAYDPTIDSLWKEYENYFPFGVTAKPADIGTTTGGSLDLNAQAAHHFNALTVVDFSIATQLDQAQLKAIYDAETLRISKLNLTPPNRIRAYEEANDYITLSAIAMASTKAVLNAIRKHNDLNQNDKRYVRASSLFSGSVDKVPLYFSCNGYTEVVDWTTNPAFKWVSLKTLEYRWTHYIDAIFDAYGDYNDVIKAWDIVDGMFDEAGKVIGQWGESFVSDKTVEMGVLTKTPVEWTNSLGSTATIINPVIAMGSVLKLADYYTTGTGMNLYWNEKLTSPAKLDFVVNMLNAGTPPAVTYLDGFGINAHFTSADPTQVTALVQQLNTLNNVAGLKEVAITQLDVHTDLTGGGIALWNAATDPYSTIDPLSVNNAVMKRQADFAASIMETLIDNKDKFVSVSWDGLTDDKNSNPKVAGALWSTTSNANLPADKVYIEKWGFFAVLGVPARIDLAEAMLSGPAINATNEAIYTTDSWGYYVRSKTTGAAVYADKIYNNDQYNDTKKATEDIYDAIAKLKIRSASPPKVLTGIRPAVSLKKNNYTYQIVIDTGGVPVDMKFTIGSKDVADFETTDDGIWDPVQKVMYINVKLIKMGMTAITGVYQDGSGLSATLVLVVQQ